MSVIEKSSLIPYQVKVSEIAHRVAPVFHESKYWGNELVIVLAGSGVFCVDNLQITVGKGDVFVLRGDYHREIFGANNLRVCSIFYREERMQQMSGSYTKLAGYQQLFVQNAFARAYEPQNRLQADENLLLRLQNLIEVLILEHRLMEDGAEQILNSTFFTMITLCARAMNRKVKTMPLIGESHFVATVAYMQTHYHEPLKLDDLADMAHFSPRHFDRKFKQFYQVSPSKYLSQLRINRACMLLEDTELSIGEVASLCGFTDYNYFSACFRAEKGCPPSNYRKRYLATVHQSRLQHFQQPQLA